MSIDDLEKAAEDWLTDLLSHDEAVIELLSADDEAVVAWLRRNVDDELPGAFNHAAICRWFRRCRQTLLSWSGLDHPVRREQNPDLEPDPPRTRVTHRRSLPPLGRGDRTAQSPRSSPDRLNRDHGRAAVPPHVDRAPAKERQMTERANGERLA